MCYRCFWYPEQLNLSRTVTLLSPLEVLPYLLFWVQILQRNQNNKLGTDTLWDWAPGRQIGSWEGSKTLSKELAVSKADTAEATEQKGNLLPSVNFKDTNYNDADTQISTSNPSSVPNLMQTRAPIKLTTKEKLHLCWGWRAAGCSSHSHAPAVTRALPWPLPSSLPSFHNSFPPFPSILTISKGNVTSTYHRVLRKPEN